MTGKTLIFEKKDQIAIIVFNRPEVYNAFNIEMGNELKCVISELEESEDIRAVILTGAGNKAFMSGTDIKELRKRTVFTTIETGLYRQRLLNRLENLGIPSFAAINGYAFGLGCEIAMACTFRIAAEEAEMGQLEINLGLMPGGGGTQRLPRLVGKSIAAEMLLTGKRIDANEALRIGLVNKVVSPEYLMEECQEFAKKVTKNSPITVKMILNALNKGVETALSTGLILEILSLGICTSTEDYREGLSAFLEKRKPSFKGK